MEFPVFIALANVAAFAWMVLTWVSKSEFRRPLVNWLFRLYDKFRPGKRILNQILEVESKIAHLAERIAILTLLNETQHFKSNNCLVVINKLGELIWASDPFLRLTGQTIQSLAGKGWFNSIFQADREAFILAWERAMSAHSNFTFNFRVIDSRTRKRTGVEIALKFARNPFTGEVAGWVGLIEVMDGRKDWSEHGKDRFDATFYGSKIENEYTNDKQFD